MKHIVKVVDFEGKVWWAGIYTDWDEMFADIKVLLKPCMFGGARFKITIEKH